MTLLDVYQSLRAVPRGTIKELRIVQIFPKSSWSLCGDRKFNGNGTNPVNAAEALVPRSGARN
jgi:hypothetical protein